MIWKLNYRNLAMRGFTLMFVKLTHDICDMVHFVCYSVVYRYYTCVYAYVTFRNHSKLVNYRLVKDINSGMFYIHSHTVFPSIHQLVACYRDMPISPDANTRLLMPISSQKQLQQQQQGIKSQQSDKGKWVRGVKWGSRNC